MLERVSSRRKRTFSKTTTSIKPPADDPVSAYARRVLAGDIVAGLHVRNACKRHFKDMKRQRTRKFPYWFDLDEAKDRIAFFPRRLRLAGGQFERKAFELHESQQFIVGSIFGWKKTEDGFRRFRRAYIEEAKGNGKSPLAAGIGLILFAADKEPGAQVAVAGPTKDQAGIIFQDCVQMVDYSPSLSERVRQWGSNPVWQMTYPKTRAIIRPISKDKKKSGPRWSCGLVDEVHEHDDGVVLDMIERGFKWRRQPLLFMITNSGSNPNSICGREHKHAIEVASGAVEFEETFSFVCSVDEDDDPLNDPSCWPKANPLLGITTTVEELDREVRQAKAIPGIQNEILRLRFCVWTDAERAWMPRRTLEPCFAKFDPIALHGGKGKELTLALDLSAVTDLTALTAMVETGKRDFIEADPDTGKSRHVQKPTFDLWAEAWTPRDTMTARALVDKVPYDVWERDGHLHAPPGSQVRFDFVAARVAYLASIFRVRLLCYDQYAYRQFAAELANLGVDILQAWHPQGGVRRAKPPEQLVELAKQYGVEPPEGLWFPSSLRALETMIFEQRVRMQDNPVLKMALSSAVTNQDAFGNRWLDKAKATNRIDPAVSSAMCAGGALMNVPKPPDITGFIKRPVVFRG